MQILKRRKPINLFTNTLILHRFLVRAFIIFCQLRYVKFIFELSLKLFNDKKRTAPNHALFIIIIIT